jgi:MoaA/NifB/PqqE/SkfB family radical SAM enzyme
MHIYNFAKKIYFSFKVKHFNAETFNKYPEELFITLSTNCNLRCKFCHRDGFVGEFLQFEYVISLKKAIQRAKFVDITGWGEPFLHPNIYDILKYIIKTCRNKRCIRVTTNGTILNPAHGKIMRGHINNFVVSLNAATASTYTMVMVNGNWEKTLTAVKSCINELDEEDRRRAVFSFVAAQYNYKEIPEFVTLAHSMGVSVVSVVPVLLRPEEFPGNTLLEIKEQYNAVIQDAQAFGEKLGVSVFARQFREKEISESAIPSKPPGCVEGQCFWPFTTCIIQMSGKMAVCCFAGDSSAIEGNAYTNFEKMWFSDQFKRLRKTRYYRACRSCLPFADFDNPDVHTIKD